MAAKFRSMKDTISQPAKLAFSYVWSASNGYNSFISTPNCAFPSFETTYSMHQLSSKKCSKSGWQQLFSWMLHVRFLFASPPCIPDLLMAKDSKASKLWFFMLMSFHFFAMDSKEPSSISNCFGDQITNKNTKTYTIWLEMIVKVFNMLIELKR